MDISFASIISILIGQLYKPISVHHIVIGIIYDVAMVTVAKGIYQISSLVTNYLMMTDTLLKVIRCKCALPWRKQMISNDDEFLVKFVFI